MSINTEAGEYALSGLTARELRAMNPRENDLYEAVEILVALGWRFKQSSRPSAKFGEGWWINETHPTKCRPVGDSKGFHLGAWDTLKAYVAKER